MQSMAGSATPFAVRILRERVRLQLAVGKADAVEARLEIERLTEELKSSAALDPISSLARRLGIDRRSEDFLSFVVACCTDPLSAMVLDRLQGSSSQYGVSVATYAAISNTNDEARELAMSLAANHILVESSVLELAGSGAATAPLRLWAVGSRVQRHLAGDDSLLAPLGRIPAPDLMLFDDEQRQTLEELTRLVASGRSLVVVIEGPSESGRTTAAGTACRNLGGDSAAVLALERLDRAPESLERGLRALRRERSLTGAIPVIRGLEELEPPEEEGRRRCLERFIEESSGPVILITTLPAQAIRVRGELVRTRWGVPLPLARRNMWNILLAQHDAGHCLSDLELDELGHRYLIGPGAMQQAIAIASLSCREPHMPGSALVSALRQCTTEKLAGLTTHVRVEHDWSELVLAVDTREQINALVSRVRHSHQVLERWGLEKRIGRASGVAALFGGPPGTGKTMVAGLVAKELGLDLHQVELSQVVSKWVGETEKQLAKIFDAAGSGHCLLLFDEADALFTKRTEVKSSNDRYSNLEVNFLLQRIEAFRGIVILTTNLDASIDPAFKRRLAAHVVFWPPDEDEREALWRNFLSSGVPIHENLDIDRLVTDFPELSGAHIRNVVLNAAFAAASRGGQVTQVSLESAARNEYASMGRVLARDGKSGLVRR